MSTHSSACYRLLACLRTGTLDDLLNLLCGNLCHSRWLTFGQALIMLYMSEHGMKGEIYRKFMLIIKYVSQVYFQIWFDIKVKHAIVQGPYHILTLLRLVRQKSQEVQDIVTPYVLTGAWFAHSEPLLASSNQKDREFAVAQILKIRGDKDYGDMKVRDRRTPTINMKATKLIDLIDWEKETIHEPVFSSTLSQAELKEILESPMDLP